MGPAEWQIGDNAIAAVAARAAGGVTGVRRLEPGLRDLASAAVRSARRKLGGDEIAPADGVRARSTVGSVVCEVDVVTSGHDQAAAVAAAVQRAVTSAVATQLGVAVTEVVVTVVDVEPVEVVR